LAGQSKQRGTNDPAVLDYWLACFDKVLQREARRLTTDQDKQQDLVQVGRVAIMDAVRNRLDMTRPMAQRGAYLKKTATRAMQKWRLRHSFLIRIPSSVFRDCRTDRIPQIVALEDFDENQRETLCVDGSADPERTVLDRVALEEIFIKAHLTDIELDALRRLLAGEEITKDPALYRVLRKARRRLQRVRERLQL